MARGPDPHQQLSRVLAELGRAEIVESRETPWASATFSGARHRFRLRVPPNAQRPFADLSEREFDFPGHIVADITVIDHAEHAGDAMHLTIEALTVEDA